MKRKCGIYGIRSISHPERVYIGSSRDTIKRWRQHRSTLAGGYHYNTKMQKHYNKYGKNDFVFEFIVECDEDILFMMEQLFIDIYKPWFNLTPLVGPPFAREHTPWNKGKKCPKLSEEHRSKISKSLLGIRKSEETRLNMKGSTYNRNRPPILDETREKMREAWKTRAPMSTGTKRKIGKSSKEAWKQRKQLTEQSL